MFCRNCGQPVGDAAAVCVRCGAPISGRHPRQARRSRVAYIVLAIFLGTLGIHNVYAGYTGTGLAQLLITLLTCGIGSMAVWVWNIVEICTVTRDADGRPMD